MPEFAVPDHVLPIRDRVMDFMVSYVEPAEPVLHSGGDQAKATMRELQALAKIRGAVGAWDTRANWAAAECPSPITSM